MRAFDVVENLIGSSYQSKMTLSELIDRHAEAIETMGERAISPLHAAGIPAYVGNQSDADPDEIVRLDPDGRRYLVKLVGRNFEVVRELPTDPVT